MFVLIKYFSLYAAGHLALLAESSWIEVIWPRISTWVDTIAAPGLSFHLHQRLAFIITSALHAEDLFYLGNWKKILILCGVFRDSTRLLQNGISQPNLFKREKKELCWKTTAADCCTTGTYMKQPQPTGPAGCLVRVIGLIWRSPRRDVECFIDSTFQCNRCK